MHPPRFDGFFWILEGEERVLLDHTHLTTLYERLTHERSLFDERSLRQIFDRFERYDLGLYARFIIAGEETLLHDLQSTKHHIIEAKKDVVSIIQTINRGGSPPRTRLRRVLHEFDASLRRFRKVLRTASSPPFVFSSSSGILSKDHLIRFVFDHHGPIARRFEIASLPPLVTTQARLHTDFSIEQLRLFIRWMLTDTATQRSYPEYTVLGSGRDLLRVVIEKRGPFRKDAIVMIARNHTGEKQVYDRFITRVTNERAA